MCGIAGFCGTGTREDLENMIGRIRYRGPDDLGFFLKDDVGLAHARLSVIDLSASARQPMSSASGEVAVSFNGEIYNYRELKNIPELSGYPFRSHSDTEVILALWEAFGERAFERLNGMFALALYDRRGKTLVLARDRAGKKPLYWGRFGNTLVFASELKAMLAHPLFEKKLNLQALRDYVSLDYVPGPESIFSNVQKLEPASYLVWKNGEVRLQEFWRINPTAWPGSFSDAISELDRLLEASVADRMIADVPLGLLLSGGLDSSVVAYYAAKHAPRPIETFSIGFSEKSFDESSWARHAAGWLGTDHHEYVASPEDLIDIVPALPAIADEPLADASIIPTYLVSKFARSRVTVALSGDGGDELFAGYQTFQAEAAAKYFRRLPAPLRSLLRNIVRNIPSSGRYLSWEFKMKRFFDRFADDPVARHMQWLGSFAKMDSSLLWRPDIRRQFSESRFELPQKRYAEFTGTDEGNRLLYLYFRTYLLDQVLAKVDRASMQNALEIRSPLLDHRVVEFSFSLPYKWKSRFASGKYILKRLMEHRLPKKIITRKKHGFAVPLASWFRSDLKHFLQETLSSEQTRKIGMFDEMEIERLKQDHLNRRSDNAKMLWNVAVFYLWHDQWMSRR